MNKMLMVASVASMIGSFNMNNIAILHEMGYEVHVACNFKDTSVWPREKTKEFVKELKEKHIHYHQIEFSRSPKDIKKMAKSLAVLSKLVKQNHFDFVHCHTPVASVITRMICHRYKVKVIYTAHGFHFYDGAPLKNWLIYYPVEKAMSRWTDVLIAINKEDYHRAKEKFHAKKTVYVPGVGIDTKKFAPLPSGREKIRQELGVPDDRIVLLSVGELNANKNHEAVIRAIQGMDLTYVIVGKGGLADHLNTIAEEKDVDLRLMGYRFDVADFYDAADVYVLPSRREGLNVSLMEAMASGLPVACSRIRGNTDLIDDCLFDPNDADEIMSAIGCAIEQREEIGGKNYKRIINYDTDEVKEIVKSVYGGVISSWSKFYSDRENGSKLEFQEMRR